MFIPLGFGDVGDSLPTPHRSVDVAGDPRGPLLFSDVSDAGDHLSSGFRNRKTRPAAAPPARSATRWIQMFVTADQPHRGDPDRDGRVEGPARDVADGERPGQDGEADRQAVVRVARGPLGRRDVEHHVRQREGEEELGDQRADEVGISSAVALG